MKHVKSLSIILVVCFILTTFCVLYSSANEYTYSAGDTDLNGATDMKDVLLLRKYIAKIEDTLPSITVKDGINGKSAFEIATDNGYDGTEIVWLESLKGEKGANGKSALEIAQENGFEGTLNEWMNSLKGEPGANGKSAYELAVENGFEGTVTEWLNSLKGKDSDVLGMDIVDGCIWVNHSDGTSECVGSIEESTSATSGLEYYPLSDGTYGVKVGTAKYLEEIEIPATYRNVNVTQILPHAFEDATYLKKVIVPSTVTKICENAFSNCKQLGSVNLPENLLYIGQYAFNECSSLDGIEIPNKVQTIEEYAFFNCASLSIDLSIPRTMTSLKRSCFYGCKKLNSVFIPKEIVEIETPCFTLGESAPIYFEDVSYAWSVEGTATTSGFNYSTAQGDGTFYLYSFTDLTRLRKALNGSDMNVTARCNLSGGMPWKTPTINMNGRTMKKTSKSALTNENDSSNYNESIRWH